MVHLAKIRDSPLSVFCQGMSRKTGDRPEVRRTEYCLLTLYFERPKMFKAYGARLDCMAAYLEAQKVQYKPCPAPSAQAQFNCHWLAGAKYLR